MGSEDKVALRSFAFFASGVPLFSSGLEPAYVGICSASSD